MAIAFRASAETPFPYGTTDTSASVIIPASVVAGDVLLLSGASNNPFTGITAGWTLLRSAVVDTYLDSAVWARTAAAGDASSVVTVTMGSASRAALALVAYSGATLPATVTAGVPATGTAIVVPSVSATDEAAWLVCGVNSYISGSAHTITLDAPLTSRVSRASGQWSQVTLGDQALAVAGATGDRSATASVPVYGEAEGWTAILEPAAVAAAVVVESQRLSSGGIVAGAVTVTLAETPQAGDVLLGIWQGSSNPSSSTVTGGGASWSLLLDALNGPNTSVVRGLDPSTAGPVGAVTWPTVSTARGTWTVLLVRGLATTHFDLDVTYSGASTNSTGPAVAATAGQLALTLATTSGGSTATEWPVVVQPAGSTWGSLPNASTSYGSGAQAWRGPTGPETAQVGITFAGAEDTDFVQFLFGAPPVTSSPAYVATWASETAVSGLAYTLTTPAGVAEGDLLIARTGNLGSGAIEASPTVTLPGWTLLDREFTAGGTAGSNMVSHIFTRVATASEPATHDATQDTSTTCVTRSVMAYRGVTLAAWGVASGAIDERHEAPVTLPAEVTGAVVVQLPGDPFTGGGYQPASSQTLLRVDTAGVEAWELPPQDLPAGVYTPPMLFHEGTAAHRHGDYTLVLAPSGYTPPGPSGPTLTWWDGAALQPATAAGWWDGATLQPVTMAWWDGTTEQPLS